MTILGCLWLSRKSQKFQEYQEISNPKLSSLLDPLVHVLQPGASLKVARRTPSAGALFGGGVAVDWSCFGDNREKEIKKRQRH